MIRVNRSLHIHASPQAVFATLADPNNLSGIVPRVRRIELVERQADYARVTTQMAFGPLGDIRSEGDVRWQTDREVVFSSRRPVPVEARWTLTPINGGTNLEAMFSLDLVPLIGLLAALVPPDQVAGIVGPDLDAALAEVARRVEPRK